MSPESPRQATQLRLSFAPTPPSRLVLDLAGLTVLVNANCPDAELFSYLAALDLDPEFRPGVGVSISIRRLPDLAALNVHTVTSEVLRPVFQLVTDAPPINLPAVLEVDRESYALSWESATGIAYDERLTQDAAAVLGFVDVPLVATDEVWEHIDASLPALGPQGRARLDEHGYIVITTAKPQLVEASTLPGLFKLSNTEFGLAAAYADALDRETAIRWATPPPRRNQPSLTTPAHLALAPHIAADLPALVADLESYNAKAIVWDSGLGRRVLVLAALEMLEAFPATVVCAPHSIWLWRRHAELTGRTCGLLSEHSDLQLVTYHDIGRRRIEPQALVFDDVDSDEAHDAWVTLRRLDHLRDAVRIALAGQWPDDPDAAMRLLSVLRPNEFRTDVRAAERYPIDPHRRLMEHAEVYLARRSRLGTPDLRAFRRSSVRVVDTSDAQRRAIAAASTHFESKDPSAVLAEILEVVSAGPDDSMGPKLSVAVQLVRDAAASGRSVVVVTRHRRTAQLVKALLRPASCSVLESPSPMAEIPKVPVAVLRFDNLLPDLTNFDVVVVLDYPWSLGVLDHAVGSGADQNGPDVIVVHATGSTDDRLALLAARRVELSAVTDAVAPPDLADIAYLVAPRIR